MLLVDDNGGDYDNDADCEDDEYVDDNNDSHV